MATKNSFDLLPMPILGAGGATAGGIADLCFEHSESRVSRQTA